MVAPGTVSAPRRSVLIGLIGQGVSPSLTPPMHEREGARQGLAYVYRPIEITSGESTREAVRSLVQHARRLGYDGLNITHPIKQVIVPLLDDLDPAAERLGAVNTVVFEGGRLVGHNTDVSGFGAAFDETFGGAATGTMIVVGAGGAGAAVAHALRSRPIERIVVVDEDDRRAELLADSLGRSVARSAPVSVLPALLRDAAGIVNATPMGMAAHPGSAFDTDLLSDRHVVVDIVYRPVRTPLLIAAEQRGCRVMNGLGMVMHQAADAFEIFTGLPADRNAMMADLAAMVTAEETTSHPAR